MFSFLFGCVLFKNKFIYNFPVFDWMWSQLPVEIDIHLMTMLLLIDYDDYLGLINLRPLVQNALVVAMVADVDC
jgi:hypothetical protein